MKCSEVSSLLIDFLYEEMPAEQRHEFLAHVEGCASCSAEVKAMSFTLGHARAALRGPLSEDPPARVRTRVLEAAQAAVAARATEVGSRKSRATRTPEPEGFFARLWKTPWLVPALGAAGVATAVFLVKVIKNPQVFSEQKPGVTETLSQPAAESQALKQAQPRPETERGPTAAPAAPVPAERGLGGLATRPIAKAGEASYGEPRHAKKTGSGGLHLAARALDNLATAGRRSDDDLLDQVGGARARPPAGQPAATKGAGKAAAPSKGAADAIAQRESSPAMHANKDEASLDDLLRPAPGARKAPVAEGAGSSGRWAEPPPPRATKARAAAAPAPVASAAAPTAARPAPAEEEKGMADLEDRVASPVEQEPPRPAAPAKMQAPVRAAPTSPAAQAEAPADKKKAAEKKETVSFEERVRKAEKLFAEKKWAEASVAFRALLAQAPSNPAAKTWRERVAAAELAQGPARTLKAKTKTSNDALDGL